MLFIDTGPLFARADARDNRHVEATSAWRLLADKPWRLATSDHVIDETVTLISRRISYQRAALVGQTLLASKTIEILRCDREDEWRAIELLEKWSDQRVSFTDCTSFALMRRHRIHQAFSFDRHFRLAGFEIWPKSA